MFFLWLILELWNLEIWQTWNLKFLGSNFIEISRIRPSFLDQKPVSFRDMNEHCLWALLMRNLVTVSYSWIIHVDDHNRLSQLLPFEFDPSHDLWGHLEERCTVHFVHCRCYLKNMLYHIALRKDKDRSEGKGRCCRLRDVHTYMPH